MGNSYKKNNEMKIRSNLRMIAPLKKEKLLILSAHVTFMLFIEYERDWLVLLSMNFANFPLNF